MNKDIQKDFIEWLLKQPYPKQTYLKSNTVIKDYLKQNRLTNKMAIKDVKNTIMYHYSTKFKFYDYVKVNGISLYSRICLF